jgi:cyclophilin family peptidyl-prolyl cis-trans isomerase
MNRLFRDVSLSWLVIFSTAPRPAFAQATRLAVLQAEDRRAPTPADLATIRAGAHSSDEQTARVGVRALGRLERPGLIPDIEPLLRHAMPEVRAEAANAIGQAAQGWKKDPPAGAAAMLDAAMTALVARLKVDADPDVRAAICETLGRLPFIKADQAARAEQAIVDQAGRSEAVTDRLGVVKGLEALARGRSLHPLGADALSLLKRLAAPGRPDAFVGARVRRLALEALLTAEAADESLVAEAARDQDAQVRRLAARAASPAALVAAAADESPIVRLEAVRQLKVKGAEQTCAVSLTAVGDRDTHVALLGLDQLAGCGSSPDAVAALDRAVTDLSEAAAPRGWHRAAHALVSIATAAPDRGEAVLGQFTGSRIWQLRLYAARAAAILVNRDALTALAGDEDDNVREAAVEGLRRLTGHDADAVYVSELTRTGYQVLRASAIALRDTPHPDLAVLPLRSAWQRLIAEGRDNSHDARDAIAATLTGLGGAVGAPKRPAPKPPVSDLNAEDLRRLAAPRARVTVRDVGTFELALFTLQAPATVLRFAHLAERGYYNGLTFHRVVPDFVIQGGSPGANEYIGDASFMRDELGLWPHVRGAVGISTRGRDTGDAQIFVDLVDNPRLDHEYTVFAQVLNGLDVVDRILEGDVIDRVEILGSQ